MSKNIEKLEQLIMEDRYVYDPPNVHHELAGGGHGRKLALKEIDESSNLYRLMINTEVEFIDDNYNPLPDVVMGMANSANRIACDVAAEFDNVVALKTQKDELNRVIPTYAASVALKKLKPSFILIIEDVGTTGKTVAKFADILETEFKIPKLEVLFTWQRQAELPLLDKRNIPHSAVIKHPLRTYKDKADCMSDPDGFCAQGVELIYRKNNSR